MKQIITFCLFLCSCGLLAQDWTVFPYDQPSWFEFENEEHYSQSVYYADSLLVSGNTNNYYFHLKYLNDLIGSECWDEPIYGEFGTETTRFEFLQGKTEDFVFIKEPLQETNGEYYFQGNLVFDAMLQVGESITISSADYVGLDAVQIACTNQTTMDVYGNMDNVKTFSLQAMNGGQAIASDFDNYAYVLSENYGFLEFLPFNELLSAPKTTAKLLGFEDDNGIIQGTKAWKSTDFLPYEAGDVIYYVEEYSDDYGRSATYLIDSITSVTISENTLSYTYYRLSNVDGSASTTQYTRTISIEHHKAFDKGIYHFDLISNWVLTYVDIDISQSDSFTDEGIPSYNFYSNESLLIYDNCIGEPEYYGDTYTYNSQLGFLSSYEFPDVWTTEDWELFIYIKGNQQIYNSLIAPLEDNYWCTDDAIPLAIDNDDIYNNNVVTYSGVGVENNVFDPSLVPTELYNTPIEITYFVDNPCEEDPFFEYYCYGDADTLFLSETVIVNCDNKIDVTVSAFLEGAYNPTTQSMNASLEQIDVLPKNQPYHTPPWNYEGLESVVEFPEMVVDWVLVEMRSGEPSASGTSATTTVVETQAGLLLANGQVVNTEGQPLSFQQLVYDESYYIALRHRNHLDVLSAAPVNASLGMSYDFTTNPAFGFNQQQTIAEGKYALFGGDYVPDGIIQNSDNDAWLSATAIINTYSITDGTLDGVVQVTDQDVWLSDNAKIGLIEIQY